MHTKDNMTQDTNVLSPPRGPLSSAAPGPHYMADLVDRAATLLSVYELGAVVPFTVWAEGAEREYIARVVWQADELAPRVRVFYGRSGDFVCQSLVGNFFEVDPSTWCTDVPSDEVDREIWQQAQRDKKRRAR